ncbi:hypothetical protein GCM10011380_19740 [Sphingomonas metalli]|uniref:Tip attachment protein J domain-containing protein n=1 Tax=Sphingomonas metalli TaxID=1779358 RepID=A0A916T3G3_9SPHN|nr:phage tail protein [Sphingomonas metalli]GGB30314.1 hypothetical protein GCM10011380_19740 [Sphingomonas metalli]
MATLVLTAVGSALGGPVGGAIGGLIGNGLDHRLLGRRRDGPRLTELAVQTSSYGTAIPLVFGTMRVAGTVIWSTDLKEARSGGGKGQGTRYGYSASFAVLLSGRPIRRIGRIWADGRLVRGAAGDLKVKAGLCLHAGGEDQPVDPLIASARGTTPAYRGMAYLVWEDLPLADFGNRIPQMTVEVIADDAAVAAGAIARAVAAEVTAGEGMALAGFAATGSVRGVLEVLAQAAGGWWSPAGGGLALCLDAGAPGVVTDDGVATQGVSGAARSRRTAPIETVPRAIAVSHYDPARDYQAGVQRAARIGPGTGEERIEMPAALSAGAARSLAAQLLAQAAAARVRRTVTLGFAGMTVAAGRVVRIGEEPGRWRVAEASVEGLATRLTLEPLAGAVAVPAGASSGSVAAAPDVPLGTTVLRAAEIPALDDDLAGTPRLTVVANGTGAGWRRATLLWSADDGASWTDAGETGAPGVVGSVEAVTDFATACLFDLAGSLTVRLARGDMMLADADDAALDRGANLAMAAGELIQFGRAEMLGAGRWRLTRLLRGRRGTEAVPARAGDGFALLSADSVRTIALPLALLGREIRVAAAGAGDAAPVEVRVLLDGASVRPPAPAALIRSGAGLVWTRRSRAGWGWRDGGDAPLGEEAERYRLTLTAADGSSTTVETEAPAWPGPVAPGTRVALRQRGTWADSLPLTADV